MIKSRKIGKSANAIINNQISINKADNLIHDIKIKEEKERKHDQLKYMQYDCECIYIFFNKKHHIVIAITVRLVFNLKKKTKKRRKYFANNLFNLKFNFINFQIHPKKK